MLVIHLYLIYSLFVGLRTACHSYAGWFSKQSFKQKSNDYRFCDPSVMLN